MAMLDVAAQLKAGMRQPEADEDGPGGLRGTFQPLVGESMAMLFQKRSTRTRVSSETGMSMLGGHALFLGSDDIQLGVNESVSDTAKVLSRFNSIILARVFGHADVLELAEHSTVPVINALSDKFHPLQMLADLQTLQEHFGTRELDGIKVAWVGDGNNIVHSFLECGAKLGLDLAVAVPPQAEYACDADVVALAQREADKYGRSLVLTTDPKEAVAGADVIVTDTWVSMGMEEEKAKRLKDFDGYQVTMDLCNGRAKDDWVFMHCLPRKPEEVDDEVFYSDRSLIWDEAENRMWTVMSVMLHQLRGGLPEGGVDFGRR